MTSSNAMRIAAMGGVPLALLAGPRPSSASPPGPLPPTPTVWQCTSSTFQTRPGAPRVVRGKGTLTGPVPSMTLVVGATHPRPDAQTPQSAPEPLERVRETGDGECVLLRGVSLGYSDIRGPGDRCTVLPSSGCEAFVGDQIDCSL